MAKGILLVAFDYTKAQADEFNDWYDLEHIPERQRVSGFGICERWVSVANPRHVVASYELDSLGVLQSPAYKAIAYENLSMWSKRIGKIAQRLLRHDGEQILPGGLVAPAGAGGLLVNAMNVDPAHDQEFNEWYDNEHIPGLAAVPGTICARRYRDTTGTHRYLALYHLESPDVAGSAAWKKAAGTPWTERLRPHFRDHVRILTKRYVRGA
jgi:hypothetical protein